ncbi:unnamed protein product [Caenorhabditis auriculariae]|uniref:CX domain-containing protein n=1 Tax=Caenorhabditis auriculariae TaxID=2777116 RepID=A0A8S1H1Q5_9PELO|nr:unnamed protein product [Caenorhabditis auriculariae]
MEIALQSDSKGILYEGYTKAFKQCVFEEGDVHGKNERYEFRCDYDLECCGRSCCIPADATIPLWLMVILIVFALLLLLLLCALLAYALAKWRKQKPKKDNSSSAGKYSALHSNGDADAYAVHEKEKYSTPEDVYAAYGNRNFEGRGDSHLGSYDWRKNRNVGLTSGLDMEKVGNGDDRYRRTRDFALTQQYGRRPSGLSYSSDGGSVVRHGVHETVEESFKQEITYERPASTDSRELL